MKSIYLFMLMMLFSCSSKKVKSKSNLQLQNQQPTNNENKTISSPESKASIVSGIIKKVEIINDFKFKDSIYLENEEFIDQLPDGGASLTGFFIEKKLVKMKEWFGLSYAILERTYFFNQDDLIYVLETEDGLNIGEKSLENSNSNEKHSETRYYFHQNNLLQKNTTGQPIIQGNESVEKDLLESIERNRKLLTVRKEGIGLRY